MRKDKLRIGYWVNYHISRDRHILQGKIKSLGKSRAIVGKDFARYTDITPIYLTDEILNQTNLERKEFLFQFFDGRYILARGLVGYGIWISNKEDIPYKTEHMKNILYLHELQDTYLELTGMELTRDNNPISIDRLVK